MVIGNLNIISISNKFGNLKLIIQGKTDILINTETKTDSTFPLNQFAIEIEVEVIFLYVREDIPSWELNIHNTPEDIKINLIKTKWLFCVCHHQPSRSDEYFLENTGKTLDKY